MHQITQWNTQMFSTLQEENMFCEYNIIYDMISTHWTKFKFESFMTRDIFVILSPEISSIPYSKGYLFYLSIPQSLSIANPFWPLLYNTFINQIAHKNPFKSLSSSFNAPKQTLSSHIHPFHTSMSLVACPGPCKIRYGRYFIVKNCRKFLSVKNDSNEKQNQQQR